MTQHDTGSLFGDDEFDAKKPRQGNALKIVAAKSKPLSKDQRAFNRLTMRIEQLQAAIQADAAKLETLLKAYTKEMPERKRELAQVQLEIAKALGALTQTIRFGKRQRERVRSAILVLCDEAFAIVQPDKETEAFYDAWADKSYQEEAKQQVEMMKREFADQARDHFGIRMNVEEMGDTPEEFARFVHRMQEQYREKQEGAPNRRKSKQQLAKEEQKKQEEALTLKSMRSIYLSLAKALHPDTIIDPDEKARKEEMMKQVNAAYAAGDLTTLLKLEMEWVRSEAKTLDALPDNQLKLYISALKEQVEALEQERIAQLMHPRFDEVSELAAYPEKYALQQIREAARAFVRTSGALKKMIPVISRPGAKKEILEFVQEYLSEADSMDPFDDDLLTIFD